MDVVVVFVTLLIYAIYDEWRYKSYVEHLDRMFEITLEAINEIKNR